MVNNVKYVVLDTTRKQYLVVSDTLPLQLIKFDEISEWNCVVDGQGEGFGAVLDIQIDQYDEEKWDCQVVSLIEEDSEIRQADDYKSVDVRIVENISMYIFNTYSDEEILKIIRG